MTQEAAMTGSFNSLEERIAHLQWRKVCNEQQIQGTIRTSKQMQEHDTFVKASKCPHQEKKEWIHQVISEEFTKPLPVNIVYTIFFVPERSWCPFA
jgi:glutamate synthase domain-containing protein 1